MQAITRDMDVQSSSTNPLSITREQGEKVIRRHLVGHEQSIVKLVTEIKNKGYSYTTNARTYILDIGPSDFGDTPPPPCSCFVTIELGTVPTVPETYHPNSLAVVHQVLSRIRENTDIPIPNSVLDTTLELIPFKYILSPTSAISSADIIPLSIARQSGLLSPEDTALIELQMGQFLGQLHSRVQNDWFGLAQLKEPADPSYSWQETFTLLLETLLSEFQSDGVKLPYQDIRTYLARAIGSFLFDDVEVPSLIWFTGSEEDIYLSLSSNPANRLRGIVAILPNVAHALWGDPLLESFFIPPAPSNALLEAYTSSGGAPLIAFPRQRTKRIWYSMFLGLITLKEHGDGAMAVRATNRSSALQVDRQWALDMINKSAEALAGAPCH